MIFVVMLVTLFMLHPGALAAQDSLNTQTELPEITELTYDEVEQQNWRLSEPAEPEIHYRPDLRLNTRHNFNPDKKSLTNRLLFSAIEQKGKIQTDIRGIGYQKLQRDFEPVNLAQFALTVETGIVLKQAVLGQFRLQAGEGLCLGAYNISNKRNSHFVQPAPGLSHPALTGFAAHLSYQKIELVSWISQTRRLASLQADKIVKLYESSLIITSDKERILEQTAGLLSVYKLQAFRFGALTYHQSYDHAFSESFVKPVKQATGIFAGYDKKPIELSAEFSLAGDVVAQAMHFSHESKFLRQSLRYYYRPVGQKLSYSKTQQIFGQATGSRELSWDLVYRPLRQLTLTSRIAAFQDQNNNSDTDWKERLILSARWREADWQGNLTWYRFRKTAVPTFDSLQAELLPTQNRIRALVSRQVTDRIEFVVTCQYQHYLEKSFTRNGLSLQQAVRVKTGKLDAEVIFLAWTNQKSAYQPSELLTQDELLLQADSDTAFRALLSYRFNQRFNLNCSAYRPNTRVSRQAYHLNLTANF